MKTKTRFLAPVVFACLSLASTGHAASSSWNVDAAGSWTLNTNWAGSSIPGNNATDNTDVAYFNKVLTGTRVVTVDANRYIGGISFGATTFGYTLSGGNLFLNNGGFIELAFANNSPWASLTDTVSSAIQINGTSGATATFTNNARAAGAVLSIGAVTGAATAGNTTTLTLNGKNYGANVITGVIGDGSGGGQLAITKSGAGTWTLSNTNTYTGATSVTVGQLNITGSLASGSAVGVSGGAIGGNGTINGAVTLSGTGGINLVNGAVGNLTLNNTLAITGAAGANRLTFDLGSAAAGADKVIMASGAPSVTNNGVVVGFRQIGGTGSRINAGTYTILQAASAPTLANYSLATTKAYGNTYSLGVSGNDLQVTTTQVAAAGTTAFWSGAVSGSWGTTSATAASSNWNTDAASNTGFGAAVPAYNTAVTFGTTTPAAGNLSTTLDADQDIKSLTLSPLTGGITIASGATPRMLTIESGGITSSNTSGTNTISANVGLATNSQTVSVASGGTLVISGNISDFGGSYAGNADPLGGFQKGGAGTLVLSGNNTFGGGVNMAVNTGTLHINSNTALGTGDLRVNNVNIGNSSGTPVTFANNIVLVQNNVFWTTGTAESTGVFHYMTSGGASFTVNTGAKLTVRKLDSDPGMNLTFSAAGDFQINEAAGVNVTGAVGLGGGGGKIILGNGKALGTGAITLTGNPNGFEATTDLTGANAIANTMNFFSNLGGNGYKFTGNNSMEFTGTATNNHANPAIFTNNIAAGKTLTFNNFALNVANSDPTFNGSGATVFAGTVSNGGATTRNLIYSGTGSLTLSGNNTYTGLTTVSSGTLGGTGTIAGSVTVAAAGSLAPGALGASAGTLSISGGLNISAPVNGGAGKLYYDLGPIGSGTSDMLAVTGTLTIGTGKLGFSDFVFNGIAGLQNGTYKLITTGGISGRLDSDPANQTGFIGGGPASGTLQITDNDLELVVTGAGNTNPTITDIANQSVPSGGNSGALAFTVGDAETAVGSLSVSGSSSNTGLVPNGNIVFGGSGASRTVTVTPVSGLVGSSTITITVTDGGALTAVDTFTLTVTDNYLSWATLNGVTGGPNGDSDNDGVKNLVEYALVNGGERGVLSGYTVTFTKRGAPYGTDLTYSIETSGDLGISDPWQAATPDVNNPITISYTLQNPGDNFARLKVNQN